MRHSLLSQTCFLLTMTIVLDIHDMERRSKIHSSLHDYSAPRNEPLSSSARMSDKYGKDRFGNMVRSWIPHKTRSQ